MCYKSAHAVNLYQEWCGQQEQGGDRAHVRGTGEAAPWVLCSVLGPSLQEGHWHADACPEKGSEAGEGSGEQVLRGVAEGTGVVVRSPHTSLNVEKPCTISTWSCILLALPVPTDSIRTPCAVPWAYRSEHAFYLRFSQSSLQMESTLDYRKIFEIFCHRMGD